MATTSSTPSTPALPVDEQRQALRKRYNLRPLTAEEQGAGIRRLPNGVYGFTFSPGTLEVPIFRDEKRYNFEVQKRADGSGWLLGYVPAEVAARIEKGDEQMDILLAHAARDNFQTLVEIPYDRVIRFKEHSIRDGHGVEFKLGLK